ncbi:MAG: hypothetical protein NTZ98_05565 [Acidobacteria bacterium]|jgi:hypothetical protein|nr:hypothetical protein [Acidobacteriota bacterium]
MRNWLLGILAALVVACGPVFAAPGGDDDIWQYVQSRSLQENIPYTVDVSISAIIPALGKQGQFHAIKRQFDGSRFQYEQMQFEGDGLVKTRVIARYLAAELEAQRPEEKLATQITPANYEFKLKGRVREAGRELLLFQVKPRKKRPGLFQGQIWIDSLTRQPVREAGKLAKLPSLWVKEINFTRDYIVANGLAVVSRIASEVRTRIVGKAKITVAFDQYRFEAVPEPALTSLGLLPDSPIRSNSLAELCSSPLP